MKGFIGDCYKDFYSSIVKREKKHEVVKQSFTSSKI